MYDSDELRVFASVLALVGIALRWWRRPRRYIVFEVAMQALATHFFPPGALFLALVHVLRAAFPQAESTLVLPVAAFLCYGVLRLGSD